MHTITLSLKTHKGEERIFVEFASSKTINDAVKQVPGIRWSESNKRWHLPPEKNSIYAFTASFNILILMLETVLIKIKKKITFHVTKIHDNTVSIDDNIIFSLENI